MLSQKQATVAESPSERIHSVQCRALGAEAKHSHAQLVCPPLSLREHSTGDEDQSLPAIGLSDASGSFHELDVEVPSAVVNPAQKAVAIEIAGLAGIASRNDGVLRAEIDHPLTAQIDGLGVIRAPRHGFRMQRIHTTRVHPTTETADTDVGTWG